MALEHGLIVTTVAHARLRPKQNRFAYKVYYLCFALEDMARIAGRLLSLGRFNLFGFYGDDHGAKGAMPLEEWVRKVLAEFGMGAADGKIVLLTLPRVLGYVFNPVSFFFCLDKAGGLRAVVSEVTNTFGDRHCYVSFKDDQSVIGQDDVLHSKKWMHVSPFVEVTGHYQFRFVYREEKIGVWIDHYNEDGLMLTTSMVGNRRTLDSRNLLYCFFIYPMMTFKVILLIHYQALKLFTKGVRYRVHPTPPDTEISR